MTEPTFWNELVNWWKEATAASLFVLSLFGIHIRSKQGNNVPTKSQLEVMFAEHTLEIRKHIDNKMSEVYKKIDHNHERVNDRIDKL